MTQEVLLSLLRYEPSTGEFTWLKCGRFTGAQAGQIKTNGYVVIKIDRVPYRAHRLAWLYMTGGWPDGQVDHKNGVTSDNRYSNLRVVTPSVNQQNQRRAHRQNKTGLLGVSVANKRFEARIEVDGRSIRLGRFDTPAEAAAAYLAGKARLHPGFVAPESPA